MRISSLKLVSKTALLSVLLTFSAQVWALEEDAQAAKEEGMRLWGIHQWETMQPPLKIAAEAGDVEAMYYLGEANRLLSRGLSRAAMDWYYQAARHGEPYAMLRLNSGGACKLGDVCPDNGDDWREAALEATLPKAEDGDADAMMALYSIYATMEDADAANHWLLEAAEADSVYALDWLGRRAIDDQDNYASETELLEAAEGWFRRAAELGYPPAMSNLSAILRNLKHYDEAWEWIEKASDAGHMNGRQWLADCNIMPNSKGRELCNAAPSPNPVEGWAILTAITEEVPDTFSSGHWELYRQYVTPEQREEGEAMKDEWLNKEPLSYFPPKYGY
ncbi:tetratricopeptide repeat protein [Vreelandella sp. GE22]